MIVDLNTVREQTMPRQCPYCYIDLAPTNILGTQEFDVVRIGHTTGGEATVFECPHCYKKSFVHKI